MLLSSIIIHFIDSVSLYFTSICLGRTKKGKNRNKYFVFYTRNWKVFKITSNFHLITYKEMPYWRLWIKKEWTCGLLLYKLSSSDYLLCNLTHYSTPPVSFFYSILFFRACIFLLLARPCYCFSSLVQRYGIYSPLCSGGYFFILMVQSKPQAFIRDGAAPPLSLSIWHLVPFTIISLL